MAMQLVRLFREDEASGSKTYAVCFDTAGGSPVVSSGIYDGVDYSGRIQWIPLTSDTEPDPENNGWYGRYMALCDVPMVISTPFVADFYLAKSDGTIKSGTDSMLYDEYDVAYGYIVFKGYDY